MFGLDIFNIKAGYMPSVESLIPASIPQLVREHVDGLVGVIIAITTALGCMYLVKSRKMMKELFDEVGDQYE